MSKDISRKELLSKLEQSIRSKELAIFAGAGLSKAAGFFDWKGILRDPASQIGLNIDEEFDLLSVAQYFCNSKGRTEIENIILSSFPNTTSPTKNHELLATLPIDTYWTTNYDDLIEQSLRQVNKKYMSISEDKQLKLQKSGMDAVVYKMHGEYQKPSDAVITRNDYEKYGMSERRFFRDVLEGDLLTKTFLFLGFGFSDPNFNFVLSKMRIILEGDTRAHYCVMKRPLENEYKTKDEYQYAKIKQELLIEDLFRNGIKVHLLDEYSEITEILRVLSNRYKQRTIFVSGSAYEYSPLKEEDATMFIQNLSKNLVERGYHIVNGYGLGVGTYIINGVSEYCYSNNIGVLDILTLTPFPRSAVNNEGLRETWRSYRKEMIERCGIALFIFGNKLVDGQVIVSDGIEEEFQIASESRARLIPLGFTGWKAEELASRDGVLKVDIEFSDVEKTTEDIVNIIEGINNEEF